VCLCIDVNISQSVCHCVLSIMHTATHRSIHIYIDLCVCLYIYPCIFLSIYQYSLLCVCPTVYIDSGLTRTLYKESKRVDPASRCSPIGLTRHIYIYIYIYRHITSTCSSSSAKSPTGISGGLTLTPRRTLCTARGARGLTLSPAAG